MYRGYRTVYGDREALTRAGYGKVAHLPCIFDSRPCYHEIASAFLIDRGLGLWEPRSRGTKIISDAPTARSIKNYSDRLCNFLEWCEVRKVDPMKVEYQRDVIARYQEEMIKGIWSCSGKRLEERTINARVGTATQFLTWAADKGLRSPFSIPTIKRTFVNSNPATPGGHEIKVVESRKGKLREPKTRLSFPSEHELATWKKRLSEKKVRGPTEALIAETILETAIRREEAACWRIDTLPRKPADWDIVNPEAEDKHQAVRVTLRYGTKGKQYGEDHQDKIGPSGDICVPLPLARKLHDYLWKERPKALDIAVSKGRTVAEQRKIRDETVHLFLKADTGERYSGEDIRTAWQSVEHPDGWTPHLGRHYWACSTLWQRLQQHKELLEEILKTKVNLDVYGALKSNVLSIIQLEIQPQLRHISEDSTLIYLQWVADRLKINLNLYERWTEVLSDESDGQNGESL